MKRDTLKSRFLWITGCVAILIYPSLIGLGFGDIFQLGVDEGYELIKGWMVSEGFLLYEQVWNDQPPLHTLLLGALFKGFGPSTVVARVYAALFGGVLMVALIALPTKRGNLFAGMLVLFFWVMSPDAMFLSASVMLEIPAMACGLAAAWLVFVWGGQRHWGWLAAAGVVMGLALLVKLTSALMLPAIGVEIIALAWRGSWRQGLGVVLRRSAIFAGGMIVVLALAVAVIPGMTATLLLSPHFSEATREETAGHSLQWAYLLDYPGMIYPALIGLAAGVVFRAWPAIRFPAVLLATVAVVHTFHHPWWGYYIVHFGIPCAWLAGQGASVLWHELVEGNLKTGCFCRLKKVGYAFLISLMLSLGGVYGMSELSATMNVAFLRNKHTETNPEIASLLQYRDQTRWFYASNPIYAFYARLHVPPELVLLPRKRFWAGQIDWDEVVTILGTYQPEQLLLNAGQIEQPRWRAFVEGKYDIVFNNGRLIHYVARDLLHADTQPKTGAP